MRTLRIFFCKKGEAAYISHLDLQRVMARALRKSGLPVWYSQGFNPHIYMSFALPLPLLMESEAETVDVKTESEAADFGGYIGALNAALPRGIEARKIAEAVHGADEITSAVYRICYEDAKALSAALRAYGEMQEALVTRKTKRKEEVVDLKAVLPKVAVSPEGDTCFEAQLPAGNKVHYSPALLTGFLEQQLGVRAADAQVTRLQVLMADGREFC